MPSETESRKRQRLLEIKDSEDGKKCLSPSIFRKSKGPIIFASSNPTVAPSGSVDAQFKSNGTSLRRQEGGGLVKEVSLGDFDVNQCSDVLDVHCKNKLIIS